MFEDEFTPMAIAVIRKEGRVLIARRKRAFMGYLWEFPGARPEESETLQGALERSLKEEMGIEAEVGDYLTTGGHVINCQLSIKSYVYDVVHLSGDFVLRDHEEVRWVAPGELSRYEFAEPDLFVARFLMTLPVACYGASEE